jgi:hypothetical protein
VRFLVRLRRHGVLYEADDRHNNNTPDAATNHIDEYPTASIDNTQSTQNGLQYLPANSAAHNPGYAVTESAQTKILEQRTSDIASNSAQHELNNHIHIASPFVLPWLRSIDHLQGISVSYAYRGSYEASIQPTPGHEPSDNAPACSRIMATIKRLWF